MPRQALMRDVNFIVRQVFANQPDILRAFEATLLLANQAEGTERAERCVPTSHGCSFEDWSDK